jgi:hypothetical protein
MTRRTYVLVVADPLFLPNSPEKTGFSLLDVLEGDDSFYGFDNTIFLNTIVEIDDLTHRLQDGPLRGTHFFVADIADTNRAGNMTPQFWDFLHSEDASFSAA